MGRARPALAVGVFEGRKGEFRHSPVLWRSQEGEREAEPPVCCCVSGEADGCAAVQRRRRVHARPPARACMHLNVRAYFCACSSVFALYF
eukprot:6194824-Pleurochrysis_carterae.AAC.2